MPSELDARVRELLADAAGPGRPLRFDRFMEIALYAPGVGYYERPGPRLGAEGDFYTAAHVGPLLAGALARRLLSAWERLGRPRPFRVVELGPGDGTLAAGIVRALELELPDPAEWEYLLAERSTELRATAFRAVAARAGRKVRPALAEEGVPARPFLGAVVANELFDAQPCRRLEFRDGRWSEWFVRIGPTGVVGELRPVDRPPAGFPVPSAALEGSALEISPASEAILRDWADRLDGGLAIFLDFGWPEAPDPRTRVRSTIATHRAHRTGDDPLAAPGSVDLSAFVRFDRLRAAARRAGWIERAFRRQREALEAWGLSSLLAPWVAEAADPAERVRRELAAKNLLFGFENFFAWELAAPGTPDA